MIAYRDERSGFELSLPEDWELLQDPEPGIALVALEPQRGTGGFRANAVVTVEPLPEEMGADDWQQRAEEGLERSLPGYLLIDREWTRRDDRPLLHRVAHHVVEASGSVTLEQWAATRSHVGITLSVTVRTLEYPALATALEELGGHLRIARA